jgi:uncharacterized protein YyaL (SSP411 family)
MPPATDRKGLSAWNYMLLSALADVLQYCPVEVIQAQAFEIIKLTVEPTLQQFIKTDSSGKHILKHSNTLENQALYLEDYVSFTDAQLRLYEVTGNEIFKKNAIESTEFMLKHFVKDEEIFMTAITVSTPGVNNLPAPFYDQSYKSSSMTLVHLLSRMSVFRPEFAPSEIFKTKYPEMAQFVLTNPLGHGEGLRALTYPLNIFRKIEVPIEWLDFPQFVEMRSHFFSRFVIDYHNRKDDSYQICTSSTCEVSGKGIEAFRELFKMKDVDDAKGN